MHLRTPKPLLHCLPWIALGLLGTGCSVYLPTLPHVPLVQARGQAEVGATVQVLQQVGAYAAYSPVNHLLVTASAAHNLRHFSGDSHTKGTQGDVGLGYYHSFGPNKRWYASALGAYGLAATSSYFYVPGSPIKDYRARYSRYHGQLHIAWQSRRVAIGAAVKLTKLEFSTLTFNGQPVQQPVGDLYRDQLLFIRVGPGAIQGQFQVGGSRPLNSFFKSASDLASTATIAGISLIVRPHLLGQRGQAAPEGK